MSINLIFILLILEFILFFAFMYLIFNLNDKVREADKSFDKVMPVIKAELYELRVSISLLLRQIEDNIYSEKLIRKEAKAFGNMMALKHIRQILRLSGQSSSSNLLFNIWRLKRTLLYSTKFISK